MPNLKVTGLEEFVNMTEELKTSYNGMIKQGLYEGARVLADSLKDETANLNTYGVKYFEKQVEGLTENFGISKMKNDGDKTSVTIGFQGYNDIKTEKYPNGQPNVLVARSINSGASYMKKQPFVKRALNKSKQQAVDITVKTIEKRIDEIQKKG